ncbi:MAG: phosphatidate cytidylyltransferase [Xanthobacteraceae bacterium]
MIRLNQHDVTADGSVAANSGVARNLRRRVASAVVLAPLALAVTYLGGWVFFVVCAIAAVAILWEWTSLVVGRADLRILAPGSVALLAATGFAAERQATTAVAMVAIGAVLAGAVVAAGPRRRPVSDAAVWAAAGVLYAGAALLGPVLLRSDPKLGLTALLFLFATVWATDVFAYFIGRAVGGSLLWPRLSPKKTWAGAIGGLVGGVAAGAMVAYASGGTNPAVASVLAVGLSVVAQGGDLFESAVKRRFGAKDAGNLIPGHGGVMDRLDGFLVAALVAVAIGILRQGSGAAAQGLLIW